MAFRKIEIEFGLYDVVIIEPPSKRLTKRQHGIGFTYADTKLAAVVCNDQVLIIIADAGVSIVPPFPSAQIVEAIEHFLDICDANPDKAAYMKELFRRQREGTAAETPRRVPASPRVRHMQN